MPKKVKTAKPERRAFAALRKSLPKTIARARHRSSARNRDEFSIPVLEQIAHEVGHLCSNPECQAPTSGPSTERVVSNIGVGAHITAAAPGGPRFAPTLSPDERKSAANAIWLCNSCGRLVDNDVVTYTVPKLVQWKLDAIERARQSQASGGRSTSQGLFAEQLELQKQALAYQREVHEAQRLEQRLATFRDAYSPFLEHAKAHGRAIEEYWKRMYLTQYKADRVTRDAMKKAIRATKDAMDRALQPILLIDPDELRRSLRWELVRPRGFEPAVDTIANQRAYADVIRYHHQRLLSGVIDLQDNVCEALGQSPRQRNERDIEFRRDMLEGAKAKAETALAAITAQYESLLKARRTRQQG